jgi:hypothetical protein
MQLDDLLSLSNRYKAAGFVEKIKIEAQVRSKTQH